MTRLRHVFLDLDGTLTDPAPGILASLQHAAARLGLSGWDEARVRPFIGPPLRSAIGSMMGTDDPDEIAKGVSAFREYFATQGMFQNSVFDGIPEALQTLRQRGFTLHLVTAKALLFAEKITAHFGLDAYLTGQYGDSLGGGKPDKSGLVAEALAGQGLDPSEVVMVGDRKHDLAAAHACGVASIGVLWGYGSLQELAAEKPNRIVIEVADLPDVVSELSRSLATDPA